MANGNFVAMILAGGAAFLSVPAMAQQGETVRAVVQIADLNLQTEDGQRAAQRRIRAAAADVCPSPNIRDLRMMAKVRQCHARALAGGETQLAQKAGTQIYASVVVVTPSAVE